AAIKTQHTTNARFRIGSKEDVYAEFAKEEIGRKTPHESVWLGGPPVEEAIRELAKCDFGVVGKAFRGVPKGGAAIAPEIDQLKQSVTKPLGIVPEHVSPIRRVLFVYTEHPEAGHALCLARYLSDKNVAINLVNAISPLGRRELMGTGAGYLKLHGVPFEEVTAECENCSAEGGPAGEILHIVKQEKIDLVIMGGTRRGLLGRLLWPELAREVVWNADIPVLVWY
ncbi:MAG: universal stress protein, partial [Candidatus Zipacnadales bacterium]